MASLRTRALVALAALELGDGSAWLGVTPFELTGLRARGMLPLPYVSSFLEINVRTYVEYEGKPSREVGDSGRCVTGEIRHLTVEATEALPGRLLCNTY